MNRKTRLRLVALLTSIMMMVPLFAGAAAPVFVEVEKPTFVEVNKNEEATEETTSLTTAAATATTVATAASSTAEKAKPAATTGGGDDSAKQTDKSKKTAKAAPGNAFTRTAKVDGVEITVSADSGVFPEGATLSAKRVSAAEQIKVSAAVEGKRADKTNVAASYTFDIKMLDKDGKEIQPADEKSVKVSFSLGEVKNKNLDTNVYHVEKQGSKLSATALDVEKEGDAAAAVTSGFSYYTVEFTYGDKQFVLPGDGVDVALADVLETIGLTGEITDAKVSNEELVYVAPDSSTGEWRIVAQQPFDTTEWMKVMLDGIEYEITLTDARIERGTGTADDKIFGKNAPIATVTIDGRRFGAVDGENVLIENVQGVDVQTITKGNATYQVVLANDVTFQHSKTARVDTFVGKFDIRYKNAAVFSDGSRKDLIIKYSATVVPRKDTNIQFTTDIALIAPGDKPGDRYPIVTSCFITKANNRGALIISAEYSVDGAGDDDTYIFTGRGYTLNNNSNAATGDANKFIWDADTNNYWAESIKVTDGVHRDSDVYVPTTFGTIPPSTVVGAEISSNANGFHLYAKQSNAGQDNSYNFGFLTTVYAKKVTATINDYFSYSGGATNNFTLTDGLTHNYNSSSDKNGKIELWTDGTIDGSKKLEGGIYYTDLNGTEISAFNKKRTYDVPYGKEVNYKMTPNPGYVIDKLYIDGAELLPIDPRYSTNLVPSADTDSAGRPLYYTYKFDGGDTSDGDLDTNNVGFDPRRGKGGCAHVIHVTWKRTCDLTIAKKVSGNQGSRDKYFKITAKVYNGTVTRINDNDEFEVSIGDDDDSKTRDGAADQTSGTNAATIAANSDKNNPTCGNAAFSYTNNTTKVTGAQLTAGIDFYLQNGQKVVIRGIPEDAAYEVTEEKEDYKPIASIADGGDIHTNDYWDSSSTYPDLKRKKNDLILTNNGNGQATVKDKYLNKDTEITFTNKRDGIIPTGLDKKSHAVWLILCSALLMSVLLIMRRRGEAE